MNREPNFIIEEKTNSYILIRDIGPWDTHLTVTNGAEMVVKQIASELNGRRLEYYDSDGKRYQLLVENGIFKGFAICPKV